MAEELPLSKKGVPIRCRMAGCRESLPDGESWSFYLINDSDARIESAVLKEVSSEWGDCGNSKVVDVRVTGLVPGAHALIWRDDGEFRTELSLLVCVGDREVQLSFEFPKLYLQKNLTLVKGLGKRGWVEMAEG